MIRVGAMFYAMMTLFFAPGALWLHRLEMQDGDAHLSTFVGQIMDSKCATVGSHDPTMKNLGAKDARDCTLRCAKDGSFVLYNPDTKTVYQLNDQEKPVRFAGQNVKISGSFEKSSQTIVIASIDVANPESPKPNSVKVASELTTY